MKRITYTLGLLLITLGCLSVNSARAWQDGAKETQPSPTPSPSLNLPLAVLRRDFKARLPIPAGEKLEYEVRFSRFPIYATVGAVTFEFLGAAQTSDATIEGLNVEFRPAKDDQFIRLRASAISKGLLIAITGTDVKDRYETLVDAKDFSARLSFKEIKEGKKHVAQATVFDHEQQTVKFTAKDLNNPQASPREKSAVRLDGMFDLVSALYFLRLQKLKEGQLVRFPVNDDGVNYWFDIVVGKHEKLNTDCGNIKTIKVEPKLFGPGKVISRPGEMTMWLTDDNKHIPLKLIAKTTSGTVNAKLTNFKNNCKLIDDEAEKQQKP
ncbi:MAG: DUF3108 domain-containing protein [Blastocatellia bacterium]